MKICEITDVGFHWSYNGNCSRLTEKQNGNSIESVPEIIAKITFQAPTKKTDVLNFQAAATIRKVGTPQNHELN